jgi:hypothetical protein
MCRDDSGRDEAGQDDQGSDLTAIGTTATRGAAHGVRAFTGAAVVLVQIRCLMNPLRGDLIIICAIS